MHPRYGEDLFDLGKTDGVVGPHVRTWTMCVFTTAFKKVVILGHNKDCCGRHYHRLLLYSIVRYDGSLSHTGAFVGFHLLSGPVWQLSNELFGAPGTSDASDEATTRSLIDTIRKVDLFIVSGVC